MPARPTFMFAAATISAVAGVTAVAAPAAAAAATQGSFTIQFPKGHEASNAPCPGDTFCGVGSLAGYGAATITIVDETFDPIGDTDCLYVTRVEQIDLIDSAGSLVIDSAGTFCRPGGSGDSEASPNSYGFPGTWTFTTRVDPTAGTGAFAGLTGGGTEAMVTAGGIGTWHLSLQLSS